MAEENTQNTVQGTTTAAESKSTDNEIEKINEKIDELENDSEDLYSTAIEALKSKRDELIEKAKEDTKDTTDSIQNANQKFIDKYGLQILNAVEALALVAIVYRLFFF
jgi:ElaB/YqjD/DUF883 family membrane-anchored ribosome-binding protein